MVFLTSEIRKLKDREAKTLPQGGRWRSGAGTPESWFRAVPLCPLEMHEHLPSPELRRQLSPLLGYS